MKKHKGFLIIAAIWIAIVLFMLWVGHYYFPPLLLLFIGLLNLIMISAFFFWTIHFRVTPEEKKVASKWWGFQKKSKQKVLLETAQIALERGDFNIAENQFRDLLNSNTNDMVAHLGFARSLYGQVERGVRKDHNKKAEALEQFKWVLEYYFQNKNYSEAADLYRKILGPYTAEEIGEKYKHFVTEIADKTGIRVAHSGEDVKKFSSKLHDEFAALANAGKFPQAQAVIEEILKSEDFKEIEPSLLSQMGEICQRIGSRRLTESLYEELAKRGNGPQTVQALGVLAGFWLNTPKQTHLAHLYKLSLERFATLDDSPEWVKLGEKLK